MFSKDINLDYNIMLKNKIPILIEDDEWNKIFNSVDDKGIKTYKDKLSELVKEQKEAEKNLRKLKVQKKKTMIKILNLSDEANNKGDNKNVSNLLDNCKEDINKINEKIEDIKFRTEILPKEIRETNFNLLKETIRLSYKELKTSEKNLSAINEEIEEIKARFRVLIDEKHDYEEKINNTYSFLHGILGSKEMEKLDKNLFK